MPNYMIFYFDGLFLFLRIMEGSWTTYNYDWYPYCPAVVHLRQCQGRLQAAPPTTTRDARKLETQDGSSPINVWLDFKNESCMCENLSVRKKLRDLYMSVWETKYSNQARSIHSSIFSLFVFGSVTCFHTPLCKT